MAAGTQPLQLAQARAVGAVGEHRAAGLVQRGVGEGALVVLADHGAGGEVLPEVAGVGGRPVAAAGLGDRIAAPVADAVVIPVVAIRRVGDIALVGERQQRQAVVVVDVPVQLGAPEAVAGIVLEPGAAIGRGVVAAVVAVLVHGEQEQRVLDDRARTPDVGLEERVVVTAAVGVRGAVAVEVVTPAGTPRAGLGGHFHAALELVAARAGDRIDDTAGGAAELDRVAAGLDLELVEEGERCGAEAAPGVHVGDVEAVDEHCVLGHRRTGEGQAAE